MQIQGFLERIDVKTTQYGNMHDLVVGGKKYGAGKFPPKGVAAGDYVQFEATQKPGSNFWNVQSGSLSKLDKPAGVAPPAPAASSGGGSYDDRQVVISKQAALNSALTFVQLLVAADALPIAKKDMTTAKAADAMQAVVDHYTDLFYKQSTGQEFPRDEAVPFDMNAAETSDGSWTE